MDKENRLSNSNRNDDDEDIWNGNHELILKQWGEACSCYRLMHNKSYLLYKDMNMRFSLPVIVLSTITGTANFAQSTLSEDMKEIAPLVIGCLNLVAGLVATVMQFLKVNELMENHRTAALAHGLLSRNIRLILDLPHNQRHPDGLKFVEECKTEYDRLLDQSPDIPKKIMINFEQTYSSDNLISKPEILTVRAFPLLNRPNTIEPLEAITKNTPLEKFGRFFSTSTSTSKTGTRDNEIIGTDDDYSSNDSNSGGTKKTKKIEIVLQKYEKILEKLENKLEKFENKLEICTNKIQEKEDREEDGEEGEEGEEDDKIWNKEIDVELGNFSTVYHHQKSPVTPERERPRTKVWGE
tara:strand:- start:1188 stop:2246 length:1059 start_codon:yes stop_codon:yes gene_type:complete